METVDEEFLDAALDFIDRSHKRTRSRSSSGSTPTRMHICTHLKPESKGKTGLGIYPDGMVEHDGQVGQLLKKLDDLGIADNTIVIYTTDNGAEAFSWPDGGTTPFRGEKNTNWEGGYRVPALIRWPGHVKPGTEINDIISARGLGADAGRRRRRAGDQEKLLEGLRGAGKTSRSISTATTSAICWPARAGQAPQGVLLLDRRRQPRRPALRPLEGRASWSNGRRLRRLGGSRSLQLRFPKLFNLRSDPFERAQHEAGDYVRGSSSMPSCSCRPQALVGQHLRASASSRRAAAPGLLGRAGHGDAAQAAEPEIDRHPNGTIGDAADTRKGVPPQFCQAMRPVRRGGHRCLVDRRPIVGASTCARRTDPLPSWNDGTAKQAILDFVRDDD